MSTKELIEAAREGDAAGFEKAFHAITSVKLAEALNYRKKEIVAEMFNIDMSTQELSEEEYDIVAEALEDLNEETLDSIQEMSDKEAAGFLEERFQKGVKLKPDTTGHSAKKGAIAGAVKGGAVGAVAGSIGGPAGAAAGGAIGAGIGAVQGATRHAVDHGINKGVGAIGRGVKKVAKVLTGRK